MINHPVHIIDKDNQITPSAFIPFCEFRGNMLLTGKMIYQFDLPVCTSFRAKIFNNQICYELDLDRFADNITARELKSGFTFIMDYNEDRRVTLQNRKISSRKHIVDLEEHEHAYIYSDTIGTKGSLI